MLAAMSSRVRRMRCGAPSRLIFKVDVGEHVPVAVEGGNEPTSPHCEPRELEQSCVETGLAEACSITWE